MCWAAGWLGGAQALSFDAGPSVFVALKTEAGASSAEDGAAWEADLDLGLAWRLRPNLELVAAVEARDNLGAASFSELASAMGSFTGLADGTGGGPLVRVPKLFLQWRMNDDASLMFGRLHFEDTLSANALSSSSATAFTNEAFSAKPAIAFPNDAFGVALELAASERLSARLIAGDADRGDEFDVFASGAVFGGVELEARLGAMNNPGVVRATLWRRQIAGVAGFDEVGGYALSADVPVGEGAHLMLRHHRADDDAGVLREGVAAAIAVPAALFGRPQDGVGLGVSRLENQSGVAQVTAETFYRWQVNRRVALTPTLQILFTDEEESEAFFGVRLRYKD